MRRHPVFLLIVLNAYVGFLLRIRAVAEIVDTTELRSNYAARMLGRVFTNRQEYETYAADLIKEITKRAEAYSDLEPPSGAPLEGAGITMQTTADLLQLKRQLEDIADRRVVGDVYETGTWRGGTAVFMVGVLEAYESLKAHAFGAAPPERHYWLYDSFEGFHAGHGLQVGEAMEKHLAQRVYAAPLHRVMGSFAEHGLLGDNVHFVKGFFETTIAGVGRPLRPIAVLRMDGDLYSSTMAVLKHLYPSVAEGGWLIIDDYKWYEDSKNGTCRIAVDEYRAQWGITAPIHSTYGRPSWQRTAAGDGRAPRRRARARARGGAGT